MKPLLEQLKKRRLALGLKQKDMMMRIGVSRQQYQQLESKGNPGLNTLELISKGLDSKLMLIPTEKLSLVEAVLESDALSPERPKGKTGLENINALADDPWENLLEKEQ